MEQGFIKLHRSILDWEWWEDNNTLKVFLYLLLNANWEDSRYRGYEIPRGSLVVGRKKMAEPLHLSEREIRTAISHLKSTNEVTTKATNKFTILTITNWEKYQGFDSEVTTKATNKETNERPTRDQQATTYKEYKNIRNKENNITPLKNCFYDFEKMERDVRINNG